MKRKLRTLAAIGIAWVGLGGGGILLAQGEKGEPEPAPGDRRYALTITNLTRGQTMSRPVVFSHTREVTVFQIGEAASPAMAALAEDGEAGTLIESLQVKGGVFQIAQGHGEIAPGASDTVEFSTRGPAVFVSAVAMLRTTNDGFVAIQGLPALPRLRWTTLAPAFDAGSEANNESCATIPGPPCGAVGVRATADAEGFVHIHGGIHGGADLEPGQYDWRNPVAQFRLRGVASPRIPEAPPEEPENRNPGGLPGFPEPRPGDPTGHFSGKTATGEQSQGKAGVPALWSETLALPVFRFPPVGTGTP